MKTILIAALATLSLFASAQSVNWSTPVPVVPAGSGNLHPRIVLDRNGNPLVLWGNSNNASFARWNGTSFTTPVNLNPSTVPVFAYSWAGPDIAAHGDTVYVVYKHAPETDTHHHIYLTKSFNGGQTFSAPVQVEQAGDTLSNYPVVTTDDNGQPLVAFMKFNSSFHEARYVAARSNDYGASFTTDAKASGFSGNEVCDCCPATIISKGSTAVVLYRNNLNNLRTIWAGISHDSGNSFAHGLEIDNTNWVVNSCPSSGPDGVLIGDTLYSVFRSSAGGTRIYYSKAHIGAPLLVSFGLFTPGATVVSQDYPRIAHSGNAAAIAWKEVSNGMSRACISFTPSIQSGFPTAYDTVASGGVANVDLVMRDDEIHVVWENSATGAVMYSKGTIGPNSIGAIAAGLPFVEVYPNPAADEFIVPLQQIASCELTDISGRTSVLQPQSKDGATRFSVTGLAVGVYTARFTQVTGQVHVSKITIR